MRIPRGGQPRPTYANVTSTFALVLALSTGGAYAAGKIGSDGIRDNAIKSRHIAAGQVESGDIGNGAVTRSKLAAAARPSPPKALVAANPGSSGPLPSGWTDISSLQLPAGHWMVVAKGIMGVNDTQITCDLHTGDYIHDRAIHSLFVVGSDNAWSESPMVLTNTVGLSAPGEVSIRCSRQSGTLATVSDTKIVAVRTTR